MTEFIMDMALVPSFLGRGMKGASMAGTVAFLETQLFESLSIRYLELFIWRKGNSLTLPHSAQGLLVVLNSRLKAEASVKVGQCQGAGQAPEVGSSRCCDTGHSFQPQKMTRAPPPQENTG